MWTSRNRARHDRRHGLRTCSRSGIRGEIPAGALLVFVRFTRRGGSGPRCGPGRRFIFAAAAVAAAAPRYFLFLLCSLAAVAAAL